MALKHNSVISWDKFGIGVSTLCMIHCLAVPVLFSVLPLWSFLPALHGWVHPVFILTLLPVIYSAIKKSHYDRTIASLLGGGFLFLLMGWLGGHHLFGHHDIGHTFETVATVAGSMVLIAGHWRNYRHHQTCSNPNHHHHEGHHGDHHHGEHQSGHHHAGHHHEPHQPESYQPKPQNDTSRQ